MSFGRTERFMQEYGKLPASAYRAYTGLYVFCATRDHERPKPCRTALRAVHRVGMPPRLEGLRPSACGFPPLRPVGLWQGFRTRNPPPRYTKAHSLRECFTKCQARSRFKLESSEKGAHERTAITGRPVVGPYQSPVFGRARSPSAPNLRPTGMTTEKRVSDSCCFRAA